MVNTTASPWLCVAAVLGLLAAGLAGVASASTPREPGDAELARTLRGAAIGLALAAAVILLAMP